MDLDTMESGERGLPGVGMFPSRVLAHTAPRPRPGAFSLHNQQCATLSRVPAESCTKCCVVLLCCDHWSDECSAAQGTYFIGLVVVRILIQSAHFIWNNSITVHYLLPYQLVWRVSPDTAQLAAPPPVTQPSWLCGCQACCSGVPSSHSIDQFVFVNVC